MSETEVENAPIPAPGDEAEDSGGAAPGPQSREALGCARSSEEPRPRRGRGRFMPHGLRKEMYEEVLRLYSQGLGATRIVRELRARFGVTVSRSTISYWVRGVHTPYYVRRPPAERVKAYRAALAMRAEGLGCKMIARELRQDGYLVGLSTVKDWIAGRRSPYGPKLPELPAPRPRPNPHPRIVELRPSPELAYVIGVVLGDGSSYRHGYSYMIALHAKDAEFVAEFARCLSTVIQRPVRVWLDKRRGLYASKAYCRTLYSLLRKPVDLDRLKRYIESEECMAAFLRGFIDSEGCVNKGGLILIFNTDLGLLIYVKELLGRLGIESTGPHRNVRRPFLYNPIIRKVYVRRKDCYTLQIRANSRLKFYKKIGFVIRRKQARLEQYVK